MGVSDAFTAFCLDEATAAWGQAIEEAQAEARRGKGSETQKRAKAENAVRKMLGIPMKFRDPARR